MRIIPADIQDVPKLYQLQLLAFESEAAMIGSRDVPALRETEDEARRDFANWDTFKLEDDDGTIIGAIRCRKDTGFIDVGRLMIHPDYRRRGLAQQLLAEVDILYPDAVKELYTCTKSWSNIKLYEKMGYRAYKEHREDSGLSFVYMRK
ncbi:GNAT family N-acetyltransferase [Megasphaera sp. DISK 18]|uniref:GNAT family N-acetyltransferase n=1 Tax=Megasphaera sp. DISK 18 TaxID=1776081 RepID=UPI000806FAE0|nr:GNAT family N-acetyltransferase [Megasphaera sp. DISK 18]OBZ33293.1 GCN5 family acetyltransferase [Megasphaera sp. DISK 18]